MQPRSGRCPLRNFAMLASLATMVGCAAITGQSVAIPAQKIGVSRGPNKPLAATLILPEGPGPFAAVIVLHGCNGVSSGQWNWASRLQGWGYAALILDSFSARGISTVCAPEKQNLVMPQDRVADILSAALYLRTLPKIDGSRLAVLGQSHGGSTAAMVTQQRYERLYPGLLKASVNYYGSCGWPPEAHGTVPLLALAGEADDWGYPALSCRTMSGRMKPNQPLEVYTYPAVWHGFDNPQQQFTSVAGHNLSYDDRAATDSYTRVRSFLTKWLAPRPSPG